MGENEAHEGDVSRDAEGAKGEDDESFCFAPRVALEDPRTVQSQISCSSTPVPKVRTDHRNSGTWKNTESS